MRSSIALLAVLLASCSESGERTSEPPARPTLELGIGERAFAALAEGDSLDVVSGCQGGRHVLVSLRAWHVGDDPMRITLSLTDADGELGVPAAPWTNRSPQREGRRDVLGLVFVLDTRRLAAVMGRRATLHASIETPRERLRASIGVRLVEGAECVPPRYDAGPPFDGGPPPVPTIYVDASERVGLRALGDPPVTEPDCLFDDLVSSRPGDFCVAQQLVGGVTVGDYDGDEDGDVLITRLRGVVLYRNDGGYLVDVTAAAGLEGAARAAGAAFADVDGDGDLDLYVTRIGERSHLLYVNRGDGTFGEEAAARGASLAADVPLVGTTPAFGDLDRDGDLDLFVGEWRRLGPMEPGPLRARLLRNEGAGTFVDITEAAGVDTTSIWEDSGSPIYPGVFVFQPAFVDLDVDGWPDLALTSDYGTTAIYWNQGDGTFRRGELETNVPSLFFGMGAAFADLDGDGALEWIATGIQMSDHRTGNRLFVRSGARTFVERAFDAGVGHGAWGWGIVALDADLDGDLDLAQTTGSLDDFIDEEPGRLFLNDGGLRFHDEPMRSGFAGLIQARGIAPIDLDRDGDVDLVVARHERAPIYLESRAAESAHWLRVRVVGRGSGVEARGARVAITTDAGSAPQLRVVGAESGFLGAGELTITMGLAERTARVHEVRVTWPRTGVVTFARDVPIDREITLTEPE